MKYPKVILLRKDEYKNEVDDFVKENLDKFDCSIEISNNPEDIQKLFSENHHILVTYGKTQEEYLKLIVPHMVKRFNSRWIHKTSLTDINQFSYNVNYCYIDNSLRFRETTRPEFSIFTSCYNSYEKITRAYDGVKSQKLKDWEWVIMDDSPDDKHFEYLKKMFKDDYKVRLYKRSQNSGNIGNVKNETIGLCRGKYLIELDHDDIILPDCLIDAYNVFEKDPEIGFVYMHTSNVYEDYSDFSYGDFLSLGYGGYITQKFNGKWFNVCLTPNINNITLSNLVACPNHPRIWRRKTLMDMGSYSEMLPICDDYEILLKTCINTKVAKIDKFAYIQFMNKDNNNFSLIRNGEINKLGPYFISPQFYEFFDLDNKMKAMNAFENIDYRRNHSQIWKRELKYIHKFSNVIINPNKTNQICIIGLENLGKAEIENLYKDDNNDILVLENKISTKQLQNILDEKKYDKMKCYSMIDCSDMELERFFMLVCKNLDKYKIYKREKYYQEIAISY